MNKKKFYIIFLFLIGIILITVGTTYAFLSYAKEGNKLVSMNGGAVRLHYEESDMDNINFENALPMDDAHGKESDYFEFTITGTTAEYDIPYVVTSRVKTLNENLIPKEYINVYLTEVVNGVEEERLLTTYYDLDELEKNNHIEQEIYKSFIPAHTLNYEKVFRLRIWLNEYTDYTPYEDDYGNQVYPMENKEFAFSINVYNDDRIQYIEPDGDYIRELCEETKTYSSSMTYKIKTVEDLVCFSKLVNEGHSLKNTNAILVANIDIEKPKSYFYKKGEKSKMYGDINEDGNISDLLTELTTGKGFKPIGSTNNNNYNYYGTLDGNNFTIKNLMINRPSESGIGLFGYLYGTVRNINLDNLKDKDDSSDDVLIIGYDTVGGIAGNNLGTIEKTHVYVNIQAKNNQAGGITGYNNGYIKTCWVNTNVLAVNNNAGGVTGYVSSGQVTEIEANVIVHAKNFVGGIAGGINNNNSVNNILIKNANVTGENISGWIGGVNGNGIGTNVIIESGSTNGQAFAYQGCPNCYYYSSFTTRENQEGIINTQAINLNTYENPLDTLIGGDNDNSGYYFREVDGEYHLVSIIDYPIEFNVQGSGTENDPYLIKTTDDWNNAVIKVNQSGVYFKLANNLDFTGKVFNKLGSPTNIFNGTLDGNNKTISGVNMEGGAYSAIVGYAGSNATIKNLTITNITVDKSTKYTGTIAAYNQTSKISNVAINNVSITNSNYAGGYFGDNRANLSLDDNNITSSNLNISGTEYIGLFAGYNAGNVSMATINGQVSSTGNVIGVFTGYNAGNISEINITGEILASKRYAGGVAGYNTGNIKKIHANVEVNSTGSAVGGVAGYNTGSIKTSWITANVDTTGDYVGGIAGDNYGTIEEISANVTVHGNNFVGGIMGSSSGSYVSRNILLKSSNVTGERLTGWIGGANGNNKSTNIFIESGSTNGQAFAYQGCNSCYYLDSFTPRENQSTKLASAYYNNLTKYDEILETAYDGDTNNTGYFFGYNENGVIDLVSENHEQTPSEICTENCPDPGVLEEVVSTGTGTKCTGDDADTEAPTCTFVRSYPISNGIAAEFYCSDNSGAPEVASLFNSTTNIVYSYSDILARGSIKTGTVTGNTRNIHSQWTRSYQLNQPEPGLCYYYQYGAKDSCDNWTTYTTKQCYYGFSN